MADDPKTVDIELAKAFHAGVEASENYDQTMKVAKQTLAEFADGLRQLTNGKVSVALRPTIIEKARVVTSRMVALMGGELQPERIRTHELYASGVLGNVATDEQRLCLVHFGESVFPLELEWPSRTFVCPNVADLNAGLRRLISDAQVAKKIRTVMDHFDALVAKLDSRGP